jgi:hypothetical protein
VCVCLCLRIIIEYVHTHTRTTTRWASSLSPATHTPLMQPRMAAQTSTIKSSHTSLEASGSSSSSGPRSWSLLVSPSSVRRDQISQKRDLLTRQKKPVQCRYRLSRQHSLCLVRGLRRCRRSTVARRRGRLSCGQSKPRQDALYRGLQSPPPVWPV